MAATGAVTEKHKLPRDMAGAAVPSDIIEAQLAVVDSFDAWLDRQLAACHDYGGILTRLKTHFAGYRAHLLQAKEALMWSRPAVADWRPVVCTFAGGTEAVDVEDHSDSDRLKVTVTGPAVEDIFEIEAVDAKELEYITHGRFLDFIVDVCRRTAHAARSIDVLFGTLQSVADAKSHLREPPQPTVREHIRLLQEYNDMKDIGQQLIGLIAENQGVLIGSLYEDVRYGVTADD